MLTDAAGEPQAGVDRLFRLQLGGTQAASNRVVHRQHAALHQLAGGVVAGRGGFVADLRQRRRAEVVGNGAAQRECRGEFVAQAQLAGQFAAVVVAVLVACGEVAGEVIAKGAGQAGIGTGHIARQRGGILRGQPTAGLRAGRAVGVRAGCVAGRVAGPGLVVVAAGFQAQTQAVTVVALGEHPAQVEVAHGQFIAVIAGLERGRTGGTQRGIERIAQAVGEGVEAVVQAGVVIPFTPLALRTGHGLHVAVLAFGNRAVAVRIELGPVGVAVGVAEVVRTFTVALVEGAEEIELGGFAERQFAVDPGVEVLGPAIAQHVVALTLQGQVGVALVPRRNLVEAGAVGAFAVLKFQAHAQETAVIAQCGTHLGAEEAGLAVSEGAVDRLEVGVVCAEAGFNGTALRRVVEDDVDHPGHRVRTIQRAGTVAQHLNAADRADRNGIEVHRSGALADLAVGVDQRAGVAAFAVHQHQHLVGREAPKLRGAHVIGTAGVGLAREVERRQQGLQGAAELAVDHTRLADVLGSEHVHRRSGFQHRAVNGTGAGDDHRVQGGRRSRRVLRVEVLGQQGRREDQGNGKAKA